MLKALTILFLVLCWVLSFVNSSGWGMMMETPEKTNLIILALVFLSLFRRSKTVIRLDPLLIFGLIATLVAIPIYLTGEWEGLDYFCALILVYVISRYKITASVIKPVCLAYAAGGLIILWIYLNGDILSGWNDNAISMVGLFSYLFFTIFLLLQNSRPKFIAWNIVTVVYLSYLYATDCRSGMVFSALAVACIIFRSRARKLLTHKFVDFLIINMPLIIAGIVIWIASTEYFQELDYWSFKNYQKGIFNARELLWQYAFDLLAKSDYLGTGKFMLNYHNSGVAAISVFGILGYLCWMCYFVSLLWQLRRYMRDPIVFGATLCFCIIFLQQSVDLGFINTTANLIPYVALGVACGRVNTISRPRRC